MDNQKLDPKIEADIAYLRSLPEWKKLEQKLPTRTIYHLKEGVDEEKLRFNSEDLIQTEVPFDHADYVRWNITERFLDRDTIAKALKWLTAEGVKTQTLGFIDFFLQYPDSEEGEKKVLKYFGGSGWVFGGWSRLYKDSFIINAIVRILIDIQEDGGSHSPYSGINTWSQVRRMLVYLRSSDCTEEDFWEAFRDRIANESSYQERI